MTTEISSDSRPPDVSALQSVAGNLQKWRQRRRMSVSALARAASVSKSTISELERHSGNPSLDTLWALARALEIPLGFLFTDHDGGAGVRVVRDEDGSVAFEEPGYVSRLLAGWEVDGEIEFYRTTIEGGARHDSESHGTSVIEHTLVIDGRIEIGIGGELLELGPGDLISFPAAQPHHYRALDGPVRLVGLHQYPRGLARIDTAGVDAADAE
ncbi:MAG TPA: XRE family transcriptional regulator [Gaiellaceae bacterium]|nr:XRE family transcriptional regulator [Gaiellaceae bacterium]